MIKINEILRQYYLNLFSTNAEIVKRGNNNYIYEWNLRDLKLSNNAEIALVQMIHNANGVGNHTTTGYTFRMLETYQDGFDSYNQTSAVIYMGVGLETPSIPTYHKLISNYLNTITIVATGDNGAADKVYSGINPAITFGIILHTIDYFDKDNIY